MIIEFDESKLTDEERQRWKEECSEDDDKYQYVYNELWEWTVNKNHMLMHPSHPIHFITNYFVFNKFGDAFGFHIYPDSKFNGSIETFVQHIWKTKICDPEQDERDDMTFLVNTSTWKEHKNLDDYFSTCSIDCRMGIKIIDAANVETLFSHFGKGWRFLPDDPFLVHTSKGGTCDPEHSRNSWDRRLHEIINTVRKDVRNAKITNMDDLYHICPRLFGNAEFASFREKYRDISFNKLLFPKRVQEFKDIHIFRWDGNCIELVARGDDDNFYYFGWYD